jgi:hypothetical protein
MKSIVRTFVVAGALVALASVSYLGGAPKIHQGSTVAHAMDCCGDPPLCPDSSNPACPPDPGGN